MIVQTEFRKISKQFRLGAAGLLLALAILPARAQAQTSTRWPRTDFQAWTDFEVAHKLAPFADVNVNGGLRWSDDADHLVYRRIGTVVGFKMSKFLTISPAYAFYYTDSSMVKFSHENRVSIAATAGTSIDKWRVSDRNTVERRFTSSGKSWRYRNRVEIQHSFKLGTQALQGIVWDEVFYDSAVSVWSRNRISVGAEKEFSPRLRAGLSLVHQNDGHTRPGDFNAIVVTIRTRL